MTTLHERALEHLRADASVLLRTEVALVPLGVLDFVTGLAELCEDTTSEEDAAIGYCVETIYAANRRRNREAIERKEDG